jgi:hypothetical protein
MATWYIHAGTTFDPETGLFSEDMKALITNPIALGEADSTVPLNLLPTVHLGTFTTTSGSSVSLTGLVLTPFRFLRFTLSGVSASTSGFEVRIAGKAVTGISAGAGDTFHGSALIDLFDGAMQSTTASYVGPNSVVGNSWITTTTVTQATTSISVSTSSGTFHAGYIRLYGLK